MLVVVDDDAGLRVMTEVCGDQDDDDDDDFLACPGLSKGKVFHHCHPQQPHSLLLLAAPSVAPSTVSTHQTRTRDRHTQIQNCHFELRFPLLPISWG